MAGNEASRSTDLLLAVKMCRAERRGFPWRDRQAHRHPLAGRLVYRRFAQFLLLSVSKVVRNGKVAEARSSLIDCI
jgi:hypothetical protein